MLDLADLRTTLQHLVENRDTLPGNYRVATASVNAILRRLLVLEREGGRQFFGEPALELEDLMQCARGVPSMVQRTLIRPPSSRIGKATMEERKAVLDRYPNQRRYGDTVDRESAHEKLLERAEKKQADLEKARTQSARAKKSSTKRRSSSRQSSTEAFVSSMARSLGTAAGRSLGSKLFRGVLGSLLRGK